jgi:MoaA/NifB/PqqE/SkfB family radical SAM enzyme
VDNTFLTLVLTQNCNEGCSFCGIEKTNISIKKEIARKAVLFFLQTHGEQKTIKFFGGEPLLEVSLLKDIVIYADHIARRLHKRINFVLATNGTLIDETIVKFCLKHEIEIVVDSYHIKKIKATLTLPKYPFLTITVNITPKGACHAFSDFKKLYASGFRRFNILPNYYVDWKGLHIKNLERQFKKISLFACDKPEIYFKNSEVKGDVPLFNTGLTCDPFGNFYASNCVLFKNMANEKNKLFLGHVNSISNSALRFDARQMPIIIKKAFSKDIISDTYIVDRLLCNFVDSLKIKIVRADIKIGYSCNNNCKFCVQGKKKEILQDKSTHDVQKILREARATSNGVVFTGGEPTIREDFFTLVSFAKKLGYRRIQIQTNARMFAYKDFCVKTIDSGANEFGVAIHGHIPAMHDYLTSTPGSFAQTVKAITNLTKLNVPVYSNTVITQSNYRQLPEIARLLVYLGVKQFQLAFVHALGSAAENFNSIVPRMSLVIPYIKEALTIGINAGITVMTEAIPSCMLGSYNRFIAERCIPSTKIYEFPDEIIDFDKLRPGLAKTKAENCKNCIYYARCEGTWIEYPAFFGWNEFVPVKGTHAAK